MHVVPARVTVTHLAADILPPLIPGRSYPRPGRYGLEPGYLLFVGTWEPRKNLPGLLEALAQLHARGEQRVLVIAGRPGWLYDEIFARVKALHLEPWVRFIEQPSGADLVGLYNGALLLAMPSFYEGFGLPALEALQCGTPVVVADRASLPEVVGAAGLLIDPDHPTRLLRLLGHHPRISWSRVVLLQRWQRAGTGVHMGRTARRTLKVYRRSNH